MDKNPHVDCFRLLPLARANEQQRLKDFCGQPLPDKRVQATPYRGYLVTSSTDDPP